MEYIQNLDWWVINLMLVALYGLLHSLLTTKIAIKIYNSILPDYSWNFVYSIISVLTLILCANYWASSGVYIFKITPGTLLYHVMITGLALSLFFFLYCFKYTTSFWQWLGVKQIFLKIRKKELPPYYKIRQNGPKKYIRFPHHTCLVFFFWLHPVMTLDTLLLAIGATIYLYVGTYHQDLRGLRIVGDEWKEYRKRTCLLFPDLKMYKIMWSDFKTMLDGGEVMDAKQYDAQVKGGMANQ